MLFTAAKFSNSKVIEYLYEQNQKIDVIDDQGRNIFHIAIMKEQIEILEWANNMLVRSSVVPIAVISKILLAKRG